MPEAFKLCLDESGARHPDHVQLAKAGAFDWFAFGGVLLRDEDEGLIRGNVSAFKSEWKFDAPLHSSEIRGRHKNFKWLHQGGPDRRARFLQDLERLVCNLPILAIACVVDRPGYNARYKERYQDQRWLLCKTAFSIVVERAAKFAIMNSRKLRVLVERASKQDDLNLKSYYSAMKSDGMPFDGQSSGKYAPLATAELSSALYEFRLKDKTSPLIQIADLCLWPMAHGSYVESNHALAALRSAGKLIDCVLPSDLRPTIGIKRSCFD